MKLNKEQAPKFNKPDLSEHATEALTCFKFYRNIIPHLDDSYHKICKHCGRRYGAHDRVYLLHYSSHPCLMENFETDEEASKLFMVLLKTLQIVGI